MDRAYPNSRAELDDTENWPYNDVQALAADLDYGPIVGVSREDLVEYSASELGLPATAPESEVDRQVETDDPEVAEPSETAPEQDQVEPVDDDATAVEDTTDQSEQAQTGRTDGGTQTAPQTDEITVGHEGSEKLQPEGAPESNGAAVAPPEGLESGDIDPELLEGTPDSEPDTATEDSESSENQGKGGLRERLGLGGGEESADDVVEDTDDPAERERREQFREKLEGAMNGADQGEVDDAVENASDNAPSAGGTTTAQGMIVDEEVVANLIDMPFNTLASATDWDGWELTAQERQANARLFVAMCDEHDVDVGPTVMFALSMGGTLGGRAMRYRRHKSDQAEEIEEIEDADTADFDDDVTEVAGSEGRQARSTEQQVTTTEDNDFGF